MSIRIRDSRVIVLQDSDDDEDDLEDDDDLDDDEDDEDSDDEEDDEPETWQVFCPVDSRILPPFA
jgi:hypothetical protein